MGSRIAAQLANARIPSLLLDLDAKAARSGVEAALKGRPGAFFTPDAAHLIETGSFDNDLPKIAVIYRLKFSELPEGRNPFGFKDGLHNPRIEASGANAHQGYGPPVKAGEFLLGYPDELGEVATSPKPEVLRRNGTFLAFRKFHTRVAAFRRYLREQASTPEEEELLELHLAHVARELAPGLLERGRLPLDERPVPRVPGGPAIRALERGEEREV